MLPIEAVLDSISEYWEYLHPGLPRPDVQIVGDKVVDPSTKTHEIMPKPEEKSEPSLSETRRPELSELRINDHSSATLKETIAWDSKALLTIGKRLRS